MNQEGAGMIDPVFLTRVVLRNYKSIGYCDVRLNPLTYLVGANGSGKSNFWTPCTSCGTLWPVLSTMP
jgi:hypothetical protein